MLAHLKLLRPRQMVKNLFCFAGVLFSGKFNDWHNVLLAFEVFLLFSAASSAVYVFNDLQDIARDRLHPKKRFRPLASGAVKPVVGLFMGMTLIFVAVFGAAQFEGNGVWTCIVFYFANNVAYTLWLKHMALVDVLSISLGFVLRLLAGIYVLNELPTAWITLCTLFLTLFLGFAKRRAELASLDPATDKSQRPVLNEYSVGYLDLLVNGTAMMAIMCYALFTTTSGKSPNLVMTVPIVFFSIMHYKRKVMLRGSGEEPERQVFKDPRLFVSVVLWFLTYFWATYSEVHLFR